MLNARPLNTSPLNAGLLLGAEGEAELALGGSGDGTVWRPGEGFAKVVADGQLAPGVRRESIGIAELAIRGEVDGTRWAISGGLSEILLGGEVDPLVIPSESGLARLRLEGSLDASISRSVRVRVRANIELFSRAVTSKRRMIYAQGIARMIVQSRENRFGLPPIPGAYEAAPAARRMALSADDRTFVVPRRL